MKSNMMSSANFNIIVVHQSIPYRWEMALRSKYGANLVFINSARQEV